MTIHRILKGNYYYDYEKEKFATTLLTTALLTCGFSLEIDAEPQAEVQAPTKVSAMTKETKQQYLVSSKSTKHKTGQPSPENAPTSHCKTPREQPSPLQEEPNTAEPDSQPLEDILQKILNNAYEFCANFLVTK